MRNPEKRERPFSIIFRSGLPTPDFPGVVPAGNNDSEIIDKKPSDGREPEITPEPLEIVI